MKRAAHLKRLAIAGAAMAAGLASAEDLAIPKDSPPPSAANAAPATVIRGSCSKAEYPLTSIRKEETGKSVILLKVDFLGNVSSASVQVSSGSRLLDQAAAAAMRGCRFNPARDDTGSPIASEFLMHHVWRLEDAPKDPWVGLRALNGGGFTPTSDFGAVPFSGDSAGSAEQRAKMLQAVRDEAVDKAQCASVERVAARIGLSDTTPERRSFESWTIEQCGQSMRYLVALSFPEGKRPQFRFLPLAAGEADPIAGR